jgi:hypothetical protein
MPFLQVWLWNLESGAVRRKLLPQGHAVRPVNEQPVERLAFMHGDHRCGCNCWSGLVGLNVNVLLHLLR